jgi:hypothetical protein
MQIFVNSVIGELITLKIKPTDRIEDVKAKIEDMTNFPLHFQTLFFEGRKLKDENTLQNYSIEGGSTVRLFPCPLDEMEIIVKTNTGKYITLKVTPTDRMKDVR